MAAESGHHRTVVRIVTYSSGDTHRTSAIKAGFVIPPPVGWRHGPRPPHFAVAVEGGIVQGLRHDVSVFRH